MPPFPSKCLHSASPIPPTSHALPEKTAPSFPIKITFGTHFLCFRDAKLPLSQGNIANITTQYCQYQLVILRILHRNIGTFTPEKRHLFIHHLPPFSLHLDYQRYTKKRENRIFQPSSKSDGKYPILALLRFYKV